MTARVNGVPTPSTPQGITQSFGNGDRIAGDAHNNILQGNGGDNIYYGGAGNDTFIITADSLMKSTGPTDNIHASAVIFDFSDAGGWSAHNNDFLALEGFGAGSTLTFLRFGGNPDGSPNDTYQYYTVHDTGTGNNYAIFIHSLDGSLLTQSGGDYNFYA